MSDTPIADGIRYLAHWEKLPVYQRLALQLVDFDGNTFTEAAAYLGVCVGTLKSRVYRARKLCREAAEL